MIVETPPQPKNKIHRKEEAKIQIACFQWFHNNYPQYRGLYFAVPNENERSDSSAITGALRKSMGVTAGVADTILLLPRGKHHCLCVEFKTLIGKQSERQKNWEKIVTFYGGKYVVCRSFEQFKEIITEYLAL